MKFVVVGAGAWGTAFALHLARAGQAVTLVPRRAEQAAVSRISDCLRENPGKSCAKPFHEERPSADVSPVGQARHGRVTLE